MGFVEKSYNYSEKNEDNEGSPIELIVVNNKQKDGLKKGKKNRDSNNDHSKEEVKEEELEDLF